ncbi:MAG TPA: GGDEF domain-containing phosphodiesterase [Sphingomonas sp.]|nr:GGDEF domain-containing phosphodiesterase [Sphingomonas sp.]
MSDIEAGRASAAPLFLLSVGQPNGLAALAARGGWRVITAESGADAERRFLASGAAVALVDARDAAVEAAVAATRALGEAVATTGAALLVYLDADQVPALGALFEAGATHFLVAPSSDAELVQALRFAARHAKRIGALREVPSAVAASGGLSAAAARRWLDRTLAEGGAPVAVLLVALTRFDLVNATYGRAAGDALLAAARERIEHVAADLFAGGSAVARMGGSEFLLAARDPDGRAGLSAERIAAALARPFAVVETPAMVGARIGVALARPGELANTALRRASEALAEARASDSVTIRRAGGEEPHDLPIEKLTIDLRHAMNRDEIQILFQPQVAIATGKIVGVEALARWEHGRLGVLGAETLFAAAERADLAIALSDRIQNKALSSASHWPSSLSGMRLSINLTAADIARPGFADLFLDRIDSSGFPRSRLTVEITESGLIDDLGAAATLLATLRRAGCRVAIDDFGTGYSSLAYLKALPLDYLKIDKRLAQDIAGSSRDRVVVRGVIEMARSLGLAVIAEGVETPEQLDLLAKEGCNYYQGFLCAEALSSEALTALIAS